jgi:hypothetical protein
MNKQLIISIGTGRCGSVSLSKFLSAQEYISVLHEGRLDSHKIRKLIKWVNDEKNLFEWLEFLLSLDGNKFVGDTGMYYLPYIEQIIEKYPQVKIIVMERDKEEVVKSYIKKTTGRNHWFDHDGKEWDKDDKWDPCYPKYDILNKEKALEKYWEDYKSQTDNLILKFPDKIKKWTIQSLNTLNGKNEILNFLNYKFDRNINQEFKHNTKLKSEKENFLNKIKKWF